MRCDATIVTVLGALVAGVMTLADVPALAQAKSRTLLAVFAHPDDEQVVSPMLARYAREGVRGHLAIATDGRKGVREHAGIPAGDALATARAAEARCACEKLKIEAPTLMGVADGELCQDANKKTVLDGIARLLADLKPDAVVTWGPDGVTGHTDHRMVSNLVTEVVQRGGAGSLRLYYSGVSATRAAVLSRQDAPTGGGIPPAIAVVDDRYLPVRIAYQEQDARAAADALACHKTQYTAEEVAGMLRMTRSIEDGAVRLRPWFGDSSPVTDLFKIADLFE
jgi:LmbE family N-acetylglucosaminyl deacetylase